MCACLGPVRGPGVTWVVGLPGSDAEKGCMYKEGEVDKGSGQRTAKHGGLEETTFQESMLTTRHLEFAVF